MDAKKIGVKLLERRSGLTQERVARDIGISKSALSMYEQGNRVPRDEIKIRLANYYGCSIEELFFNN